MTYNEFREVLLDKIDEKMENGEMKQYKYRLYEDGETSEDKEDLDFIRETNRKYHKKESDVLEGDFLAISFVEESKLESVSRLELKAVYEMYEEGGWDTVWAGIEESKEFCESISKKNILDDISEYEKIKKHLILRPLNFTDNRYELKKSVYRQVGDMALVLYILVAEDERFGLQTTKVPKQEFEHWGKDFDEVFDVALANSNVRSVPRMYNASDMKLGAPWHPDYNTGAYMALGSDLKLTMKSYFTTYPCTNGAISFFYPGVQERIAKMAGGDYYIAFTGISEFHIHRVKEMNPRTVLQNLKYMNREVNRPDEILSRKVYQYKVATGELVMLEL